MSRYRSRRIRSLNSVAAEVVQLEPRQLLAATTISAVQVGDTLRVTSLESQPMPEGLQFEMLQAPNSIRVSAIWHRSILTNVNGRPFAEFTGVNNVSLNTLGGDDYIAFIKGRFPLQTLAGNVAVNAGSGDDLIDMSMNIKGVVSIDVADARKVSDVVRVSNATIGGLSVFSSWAKNAGIDLQVRNASVAGDLDFRGTSYSDQLFVSSVNIGGSLVASLGDEADDGVLSDKTTVENTTVKSLLRVASGNGKGTTLLSKTKAARSEVLFGSYSGDSLSVYDCTFASVYWDGDLGSQDNLLVLRTIISTPPVNIRFESVYYFT